MSVVCRVWGLVAALVLSYYCAGAVAPVNSIPVKVVNHAGAPIQVFWVDTFSGDGNLVPQTSKPLRNSSDTNINSYNGHHFVAKFFEDIPGVEAFFTKGPSEETVMITYDADTGVMNARQITKFDEIMDLINDATGTCNDLKDSAFADCIGNKVLEEVQRLTETTKEVKRYRDLMLPRLQEYVCADDKPNYTEPLRTLSFEDRKDRYDVDVMVDMERVKVWVVPEAISTRECELLHEHSTPVSHTAGIVGGGQAALETRADGSAVAVSGQDTLRPVGIVPQRAYEIAETFPDKDPLWPLFSKIYKLTHYVSKHRLPVLRSGQEGFGLSTLGVGEGVAPFCAGACDQSQYRVGDRIASALLFCEAAETGGTLTFPKADLVIRPTVGMGVFVTYKGVNSTEMDEGYAEHSLCPVRTGRHALVSLHLRDGVAAVTAPALGEGKE